jgi:hypothetical protein
MTGTDFFLKNLNYQTLTCTSQSGLFTKKSVPGIFEPPCIYPELLILDYIRPAVTYEAETWTMTKKEEQEALLIFER